PPVRRARPWPPGRRCRRFPPPGSRRSGTKAGRMRRRVLRRRWPPVSIRLFQCLRSRFSPCFLVTLVRESLGGGRIGELWPEGKVSVTQSPTRDDRRVQVTPKVGVGPERAHSGPTRTAVVWTLRRRKCSPGHSPPREGEPMATIRSTERRACSEVLGSTVISVVPWRSEFNSLSESIIFM